jgi:PHO85 cyclin-5
LSHLTFQTDQTIKKISQIWRIQDIPSIFLNTTQRTSCTSSKKNSPQQCSPSSLRSKHKQQLPSPLTPSSTPSAFPPSNLNQPCSQIFQELSLSQIDATSRHIKGFVHEVLRRSRTSGCVLQTALCYLEAIHPKVNQLVTLEKAGKGFRGEPVPRALVFDEHEPLDGLSNLTEILVPTVKVSDCDSIDLCPNIPSLPEATPGLPLVESMDPSELPSPLLCPRRAFLAALILASKFTQDKCYSNRAWAKLSGLSPREISRCERALGDALGWRLWVGKSAGSPAQYPDASDSSPPVRSLSRCHSESDISNIITAPFLPTAESSTTRGNCLRRCSTVPSEVLGSQAAVASLPLPPVSAFIVAVVLSV